MKKGVIMVLALAMTVLLTAPAFADEQPQEQPQPLLARVIQLVFSPITGTLEMGKTTVGSIITGEDGPIVSALRGMSNGIGRVLGSAVNVLDPGVYDVPYFEDNDLAAALSVASTPIINIVDWCITGGVVAACVCATANACKIVGGVVAGAAAGAVIGN